MKVGRRLVEDLARGLRLADLQHQVLLIRLQGTDLRLEAVDLIAHRRHVARLREVEEGKPGRRGDRGQQARDARLSLAPLRANVTHARPVRGAVR
jgi:hypothetical protein